MKTGIVIISGPSGVGKTTLYKRLLAEFPERLAFSVSATTRKPRPGEVHGVDYYFYTREDFEKAKENGEFAEWAEVYGNYYGTLKSELEQIMSEGKTALLDVDVQGGMSIKKAFPEAFLVFIKPPSIEELRKRIQKRCSDDPETIERRLKQASEEMKKADFYSVQIENRDLEEAYQYLKSVLSTYLF
ncbi:guanylate kinase [Thermospira aquatica]|uniref:Guanylate kinase n=1 Tax=Thermospira aquatica TaxID=2828656 RepID=A0AAX3BDD6_9SPIR|nr:guanylate kinase [Thermospira aquatica]URA10236.1 guanylate kinase [Thermospira aquatica]